MILDARFDVDNIMEPSGLYIDVNSLIVSDIWIFNFRQNWLVTLSSFCLVLRCFQCVFISTTVFVVCMNSHIHSNICAEVDSHKLPELWYRILVEEGDFYINEFPYTCTFSCIIVAFFSVDFLSIGWWNDYLLISVLDVLLMIGKEKSLIL